MADVNSGRKDVLLCQIIRICGGNDLVNLFALPTVVALDFSFQ